MTLEKNTISGILNPVVQPGREFYENEARIGRCETRFVGKMGEIVEKACPELKPLYDSVADHIKAHLECERGLAETNARAVEDLNDITERYAMLYAAYSRYTKEKKALCDARAKLQTARGKLAQERAMAGKNQAKAEDAVRQGIETVKQRIRSLQDRIRELIEFKEKFNVFKQRRMRESFLHLGEGTSFYMNQDVEVWKREEVAEREVREKYKDVLSGARTAEAVGSEPLRIQEYIPGLTKKFNAPPAIQREKSVHEEEGGLTEQAKPEAHDEPVAEAEHESAPISIQDPEPEPTYTPEEAAAPQEEQVKKPGYNPFDNPF